MLRIIRAICLTLAAAAFPACICFADMTGDNGKVIPAAVVNIPVTHEIAGDSYTGNDEFTFVLTAEEDKNPMPQGSDRLTRTVTVSGDASPDFGDITLEYPDAYYYTVSRKPSDHRNLSEGEEVYRVMIVKYNNGASDMIIWNEDEEKADEIVFRDVYTAPRSPRTGDDITWKQMLLLSVTAAASGIVLAILISRRKKEDDPL